MSNNLSAKLAQRDFSKATIKALGLKGIEIVGSVWVPASSGEMPFANGETAYQLVDNGTLRIRTHRDICALAA